MEFRLEELMNVETAPRRRPNRRHFIGGSDARIIMGPDEAALIRLWKEKRGEVEPEDLSSNLVVQLGVATEALNRAWYERFSDRYRPFRCLRLAQTHSVSGEKIDPGSLERVLHIKQS